MPLKILSIDKRRSCFEDADGFPWPLFSAVQLNMRHGSFSTKLRQDT